MTTPEQEGAAAFAAMQTSRYYGSLQDPRTIDPADAARLFLAAAEEANIQIARPLDPYRQRWIEGFRTAQEGARDD